MWVFEAFTFSRQSAHRWRWGRQPYPPVFLYPEKDSWHLFLLEASCGWKDVNRKASDNFWTCYGIVYSEYLPHTHCFLACSYENATFHRDVVSSESIGTSVCLVVAMPPKCMVTETTSQSQFVHPGFQLIELTQFCILLSNNASGLTNLK
jgi:hypothetical protein